MAGTLSSPSCTAHGPSTSVGGPPLAQAPRDSSCGPQSLSHITAVTQLSPDRVDRLVRLAERWVGPISVALYVCPRGRTSAGDGDGDAGLELEGGGWDDEPRYGRDRSRGVVPAGVLAALAPFRAALSRNPRLAERTDAHMLVCASVRWVGGRCATHHRHRHRHPLGHRRTAQGKAAYPANLLRNVALQRARTHAVFLTDVDFVTSEAAYAQLYATFNALR